MYVQHHNTTADDANTFAPAGDDTNFHSTETKTAFSLFTHVFFGTSLLN